MRRRGTVREWVTTHGWIEWPGGAVFVHHTAIEGMKGYKSLIPGEVVEFEIEEGARGFHAVRVRVIESAETVDPDERDQREVSCDR